MRCEDFLENYDGLEPGVALPWILARHLDACESCRREVSRLETALAAWKAEEEARGPDPRRVALLEERIMAAVMLTPRPRRVVALGQWATVGALLAVSGVLMPFVQGLWGFGGAFNDAVLFPLALVLGTSLAIFGFLFIGSHFEELRGMLDRSESAQGFIHRH